MAEYWSLGGLSFGSSPPPKAGNALQEVCVSVRVCVSACGGSVFCLWVVLLHASVFFSCLPRGAACVAAYVSKREVDIRSTGLRCLHRRKGSWAALLRST